MSDVSQLLDQVNWDFPTSLPGVGNSLHWYPGTFPHALPATLIQALAPPGGLVFDPYSGVGTTCYEAIRQSRRAIGVDANPVAVAASAFAGLLLFAQRASPLIVPAILDELTSAVRKQEKQEIHQISLLTTAEAFQNALSALPNIALNEAVRVLNACVLNAPAFQLLERWLHPITLLEMKVAHDAFVTQQPNPLLKLGGLIMISAVLRATSSQTASWGHVADNVRPKQLIYKPFYLQCRHWITRTSRIFREAEIIKSRSSKNYVADMQLLNWLDPEKGVLEKYLGQVDLMITSPPYASAIDYTLSQRLSHYLFGFSDESLMTSVSGEIGARRKRFHAAPEEIWATQLATSLEEQLILMKSTGLVCVVLPHKDAGRMLGAEAFEVVMRRKNWRLLWTGSRSIRQSRTRQSWTSIQKETIQVFAGDMYK